MLNWHDRGLTEIEFRHGVLNDPRVRPALFLFRDAEYDAQQAEAAGQEDAAKWKNATEEEEVRRGCGLRNPWELVGLDRSAVVGFVRRCEEISHIGRLSHWPP